MKGDGRLCQRYLCSALYLSGDREGKYLELLLRLSCVAVMKSQLIECTSVKHPPSTVCIHTSVCLYTLRGVAKPPMRKGNSQPSLLSYDMKWRDVKWIAHDHEISKDRVNRKPWGIYSTLFMVCSLSLCFSETGYPVNWKIHTTSASLEKCLMNTV